MYLRKTTIKDLNLYWLWFNDPAVRENSLSKNIKVTFKNHSAWFQNTFARNDVLMYILVKNSISIGKIPYEE